MEDYPPPKKDFDGKLCFWWKTLQYINGNTLINDALINHFRKKYYAEIKKNNQYFLKLLQIFIKNFLNQMINICPKGIW